MQAGTNVVRLDGANDELRNRFPFAGSAASGRSSMRSEGGRPTIGMSPLAHVEGEPVARVVNRALEAARALGDDGASPPRPAHPRTRPSAVRTRSSSWPSAHYQAATEFSDTLTASFAPDSGIASRLVEARECGFDFEQFGQRFRLRCNRPAPVGAQSAP